MNILKRKAVISVAIGIGGMIYFLSVWVFDNIIADFSFFLYEKNFKLLSNFIDCFFGACSTYTYLIASLVFAVGIYLGTKGSKSPQRKVAILGIILCTIDLVVALVTTYVWWWFLAR